MIIFDISNDVCDGIFSKKIKKKDITHFHRIIFSDLDRNVAFVLRY